MIQGHLVDQKSYEISQSLVLIVPLLSLPIVVVALIDIKQASLLLKVIIVQAVDRVEIVRDQKEDADPFHLSWGLDAKDDHKAS